MPLGHAEVDLIGEMYQERRDGFTVPTIRIHFYCIDIAD